MDSLEVIIRKPSETETSTAKTWPIWKKEVSEFDWSYSDKETCLILEGEVEIISGNKVWRFSAGDYVIFPEGLKCVWKIKKSVKKHYNFG